MKVAFVTPRYGPEVMGGAESAARQLAEHLVAERSWPVEVFTTCALDHITWDDVLDEGDSTINGVSVHRFRSEQGRDPGYYALDGRLREKHRTTDPTTSAELFFAGPSFTGINGWPLALHRTGRKHRPRAVPPAGEPSDGKACAAASRR